MAGVAAGAIVGALTATGTAVASHQTAIKSRRLQRKAQEEAKGRALSTERKNAMAQQKASRKKPDIGAIIASNQAAGGKGVSSTDLTGSGGMYSAGMGASDNLGGY